MRYRTAMGMECAIFGMLLIYAQSLKWPNSAIPCVSAAIVLFFALDIARRGRE